MAFDEGSHLGIIKIYAHQWSPILAHQPPGPATYGALTTDPSYLYHYLLSFPYRLLDSLLANKMLVIVALRFINIAFFAAGLVFFRNLLLKTKASVAVVHVSLLFFVLTPVVPLLAGQINYDNLLMVLLPLNLLQALRFREQLLKKRLNLALLFYTISLGLLASLVVFVYLPMLTAVATYLLYLVWRHARQTHHFWLNLPKAWRTVSKFHKIASVVILVISSGMFVQRYGVAIVRYHNLIPQCGQVLSVEQCSAYGPWARNYNYAQSKQPQTTANPLYFAGGWLYGMYLRSFFAINGPGPVANFDNEPPLPLITLAAITVFVFGIYLFIRYGRRLLRGDPGMVFLLFVGLIYLVALIGRNYHDYVQLGHLVAINGRYLVLIILPILVLMGQAYKMFLPKQWQGALLAVVFLLFLQGGGFLSFIYDSNNDWYRHDSQTILNINQHAHKLVRPFILNWPINDD